ncbi:hypothetical protein BV25DRAFT_1826352 [Artomyces pyxidatus]|uniref:Uncharacterized protein n=1 Tax=Artomyces pyxidatus TaxID=48021 RepID=A0ACB8T0W6_9AGAM|nr:hypothetical protein BV25DRAFT_1826352 [Artomyces pyxidatus]
MSKTEDENPFFERERDRLVSEVTTGFEELLSSSNILNRKLEEVLGMTKEYETIAALWGSFHELMRGQRNGADVSSEGAPPGLPGTGGHIVTSKQGNES